MTRAAASPNVVLAPFSRRWWCQWVAWTQRGIDCRAMAAAAGRGQPWTVRREAAASDFAFVAVAINSPAFVAWAEHFQRHGAMLPRPSLAPVIFMPAALPPEAKDAA